MKPLLAIMDAPHSPKVAKNSGTDPVLYLDRVTGAWSRLRSPDNQCFGTGSGAGIRMDPHVFDPLDPDPDPQKICGSRIQGYQIDQNRRKLFIEMNEKNR